MYEVKTCKKNINFWNKRDNEPKQTSLFGALVLDYNQFD